jgi:hypothetical protein
MRLASLSLTNFRAFERLENVENLRVGGGLGNYRGKLQFASMCGNCGTPGALQHTPFAAGVFPFPERGNDDFEDFSDNMCHQLRSAVGDGPQFCSPGSAALTSQPSEFRCAY